MPHLTLLRKKNQRENFLILAIFHASDVKDLREKYLTHYYVVYWINGLRILHAVVLVALNAA